MKQEEKTIKLSDEQYRIIKKILRVADVGSDTIAQEFPDNSQAREEARVVHILNTEVFA